MAGTFIRLGSTTGTQSATETVNLEAPPSGGAARMFLVVNVTVAGSTPSWVITVNKRIGGNVILIGTSPAIVATGIVVIALDAEFDGKDGNTPNQAIPLPDQLVFTRTTGTLAAEVYMAAA